MIDYSWQMPTKIVYGKGRHSEIGSELTAFGKKALMIYGGGSIKRNGVYDDVVSSLQENGIAWTELSGIRSNPVLSTVNKGIAMCREEKPDVLLAIGGGSVIDTAKTIACGAAYDGDVWDFFCGKAKVEKALPIAVILTIPGTGSEVSGNAVLTNEEKEEKRSAISVHLRPRLSILDPTLCTSVPVSQIAPCVYDMLSHTMERYFSPTMHTDTVDGVAEGVMKSILKNGPRVLRNPKDTDAWGELMLAADFSHNSMTGFGKVGDWTNHNIEEVISGVYNIPHGSGLAVLTPQWMRCVYKKHLPLFVQFAVNVMGVSGALKDEEEIALEGIEALEDFTRKMGLPLHLSEMGVDDSRLEEMAKACTSWTGGTCGKLEPLDWQDVLTVYRNAL